MKLTISFSIIFFLIGCTASKLIPLKSKLPSEPYTITSEKSRDQVWDNLIDLFAQKGISIKIIDKSSGLIISEQKTALTVTTEGKDGVVLDTTAWAIAPRYYDPGPRKYYKPIRATGEWNVRIKESGTGTIININLLNVQAEYGVSSVNPVSYSNSVIVKTHPGHSTHKFEQFIANYINK